MARFGANMGVLGVIFAAEHVFLTKNDKKRHIKAVLSNFEKMPEIMKSFMPALSSK